MHERKLGMRTIERERERERELEKKRKIKRNGKNVNTKSSSCADLRSYQKNKTKIPQE